MVCFIARQVEQVVDEETGMSRTTPEDWLDEGLAVLAVDGPDGLTIDGLCRRLDVTKGSFHHHFDGYPDFESRLLEHFEDEGTHEIIETVEREPTPEAKFRRLLDIVVEYSRRQEHDPEIAIRAWAHHDEAVREVQERVDERRVEYVRSLCREMGFDDDLAERLSNLVYAVIVGCEQMHPPIRGDNLRALFDECLDHYDLATTESR